MKKGVLSYILPNLFFVILVICIFLPPVMPVENKWVFFAVVVIIEINLLINIKKRHVRDINTIVFLFLAIWEFFTTEFKTANTMLYPIPENVFYVCYTDYKKILEGIGSSLKMLLISFIKAVVLGE